MSSRVKPHSKAVTRITQAALPRLQDIDADTILSDQDDDDGLIDVPQYHQTSNLFSRRQQTRSKPSIVQNNEAKLSMVSSLRGLPDSMRRRSPPSGTSVSEAETIAPSATPSSYDPSSKERRYYREAHPNSPDVTRLSDTPRPITGNNRFSGARLGVVQTRGRHTVDEDDAWNQIRLQQLEAEADRFREERLLERCWQVWTKSYQWIMVCT